jgi:hypothetical protein
MGSKKSAWNNTKLPVVKLNGLLWAKGEQSIMMDLWKITHPISKVGKKTAVSAKSMQDLKNV